MLCAARNVRVTTSGGRPSAGRGASFGRIGSKMMSSRGASRKTPNFARGVRTARSLPPRRGRPQARWPSRQRGAVSALPASRRTSRAAFGQRAEAPCPSCHVDTRHVGPGYVAAVSGRVVQDTGEDLDRLLDEWRTGRVDVIDPARERRPAGRGEVDQEAARVWPDRFLPDVAFLEQKVVCRGVHFASFASLRTSSRIASSKSSPPRRRMPSLVTTSLQRPVIFRSEASNVPPPRS